MKWYYGNKIFLFYLQTMPLTGPIGLPCALNYTLNSASMCTFDVSKLDSINLQCPESSTLIGQMCIGSCSASFIPSPTLGCVTNPELRENYRVPNETTSCPSGKTSRILLSPPAVAGKFCVPSNYQPVDSIPFCPVGYTQSDNQCYKPCPSSSDFISNPPLCYAIYGDQYNPLPQPAPTTTIATLSLCWCDICMLVSINPVYIVQSKMKNVCNKLSTSPINVSSSPPPECFIITTTFTYNSYCNYNTIPHYFFTHNKCFRDPTEYYTHYDYNITPFATICTYNNYSNTSYQSTAVFFGVD